MSDTEQDVCPHCGSDQRGEEIPEQSRSFYGGKTHSSRTLGIEVSGLYDGILFWACPDCGGRWHRWPAGTRQHDQAQQYVQEG